MDTVLDDERITINGPPSLDSDYDEYLALSDGDVDSPGPNKDGLGVSAQGLKEDSLTSLPFSNIHKKPVKFKSSQRELFIPGQDIELLITSYERSVTTHILNPNLYTIELKHGDYRWTIKKRYKQIQHLHQQLRLFRASLNIPFPTKTHREKRSSFKHEVNKDKHKKTRNLPRFPSRPEALVPFEQIEHRMKQLEEYLQNLLKIKLYRNHHETGNFLEVSELSFIGDLGTKGKEGLVQKRSRSSHPGHTGCNCCGFFDAGICVRCHYFCNDICGSWRSRWLVVKDSFIAYIRPDDGIIKAVMLFDSAFEVSSGVFATGHRNGLFMVNHSRQLIIKCPTRRTSQDWLNYIKDALHKNGSDFLLRNRYYSFVPQRVEVKAGWLVDGKSYMACVAQALEAAKEEIYIADWWLSPEIYLQRPYAGDKYRLDKVLLRKAEAGVKVFVLLYKEVEMALGINSYYSKQRLTELHENIKVLRHPDHAKAGVFLWAHHEKIVVVDQSLAFIGGIDLCYGRWDDYRHMLTDLGDMQNYMNGMPSLFSITMATNAMASSFLSNVPANEVCNGSMCMLPSPDNIKRNTPELERKNIFDTVKDKGKGLIHMWSFSSTDGPPPDENNPDDFTPQTDNTSCCGQSTAIVEPICGDDSEVIKNEELPEEDDTPSSKLWIGKDYCNFIVKDFCNLDQPFIDLVDRGVTPRMPWHDVGVVIQGSVARDVARHFIQRWNSTKTEKARSMNSYPYLLPKSYEKFSIDFKLPNVSMFNVSCQVLRSVSYWSAGLLDVDTWEGSIHEAYVDVIAKANHYIYMENQFFISLPSIQVKNQVADTIVKRIVRAHREGSTFRVFIVLPLLPGFEGEVGTPSGTALHAITHWNYASICRGKQSLLSRLVQEGITDPRDYITFHGLRNHAYLRGQPISELVYVHSKLLIADDKVCICGSANINDRSLLGKRDSEIAVIIEDEEYVTAPMNGQDVPCGKFVSSLRKHLFKEHLGLLDNTCISSIDVSDPVTDEFYHNVWRLTAINNTDIYEKVFHCIPSDQVTDFQTLKKYIQERPLFLTDPEVASDLIKTIQGHLVMLPLDFLKDEILTPNSSSVTGMMPTSLWT